MNGEQVTPSPPERRRRAAPARLAMLAIVGVTGVIIFAVAFVVDQRAVANAGVTSVALTGTAGTEPPTVGRLAPDFTATTVDGRTVTLSDLAGRAVWLTFGASWCQPCRAENADIEAAYDRLSAEGITVVAVFIGENPATVRDYAARAGLTYRQVADPVKKLAAAYRVLGIPSHFFIDRSGIVRQIRIGTLDPAAMEVALTGIGE